MVGAAETGTPCTSPARPSKRGDELMQDAPPLPSSSPLSSSGETELIPPTPIKAAEASTASTTAGRNLRKRSQINYDEDYDANGGPSPVKPKARATPRKTARKSRWNAENILADTKSPLATANLRTLLSDPTAWEVLTQDERAEILSFFPDKEHVLDADTDEARLDYASLLNDDSFRHDCAAYTQNLALGKHDPEWLASAWAAHERRKMGDFDEFVTAKLEGDWDVEIPEEMKVRRQAREAGGKGGGEGKESVVRSDAGVRDSEDEDGGIAGEVEKSGEGKREIGNVDDTKMSVDG